ncbi:MAG: FKBP-type peptidyl-prolyl cis-trans isomerase [Lachnospiraceae bacterium]|nr:FKBP-type peptidyl-prolyl cis-trans isomerase [Lachnospiraceae bacterium]
MSSEKREAQKKNREKAIQKAKTVKTVKWIVIAVVSLTVLGIIGWAVASSIVVDTKAVENFSEGLNDDGTVAGIKATDYVELCDYKNISVSRSEMDITEEDWNSYVENILAAYPDNSTDTSIKIKEGDTINLDYVGSIDGVEFQGGSTGGMGTSLTIGSHAYIDGFEDAIIGHNVGENFDINVTFPENYGKEELNGKDAVFNITVNSVEVPSEFNDDFIKAHYSDVASNTEEYKQYYMDSMFDDSLKQYLTTYVRNNSTVKDYPKAYLKTVKGQIKNNDLQTYEQYKAYGGEGAIGKFEDFTGLSKKEYEASITTKAQNTIDDNLKFQAIFEDAGLTVTQDDVNEMLDAYGLDSAYYSVYEETYGKPYLYQTAMSYAVLKYLQSITTVNE